MDSAFMLPIHISYRQPVWLLIMLVVFHTGAIICVLVIDVPIWLQIIIITGVLAGLSWYFYSYYQNRTATPPLQLVLNADDEWKLIDRHGERCVQLLPGALVHPALVVMRFTDGRREYPVVLTVQAVDRDVLRRLRVRLRFSKNVKRGA